ncbi:hypothetical protein GIX45_04930 [Erwinia sp. CPCC 100877]|nr:hypothetical protein [Erwinia sp. CPCC 100877]
MVAGSSPAGATINQGLARNRRPLVFSRILLYTVPGASFFAITRPHIFTQQGTCDPANDGAMPGNLNIEALAYLFTQVVYVTSAMYTDIAFCFAILIPSFLLYFYTVKTKK